MDVLSDVLRAVRLTGAVFYDVEATAPFAAESPRTEAIAERVMAGSGQVIAFHVVTSGSCWMELIGPSEPAIELEAGEIVIFPEGDRNTVTSAPGMRGKLDESLYYRPDDRLLPFSLKMNADTEGATCRFVCGYLGWDSRPFNPLINALPRVIRSPLSQATRGWLTGLLDVAIRESVIRGAGSEAMLARLAELMFVEVMRSHIESLPEHARGWFAGLRDPQIGAALALIHGRPAHPWSLDVLAREVGMSRSAFAEHFNSYVGIPPMQYLARWRAQVASVLLDNRKVTIAEVAEEVGYQSEAAFNRAFKRHVGVAPGAWRRGREVKTPATYSR
jgi:AraC-like DNA-binding protein